MKENLFSNMVIRQMQPDVENVETITNGNSEASKNVIR